MSTQYRAPQPSIGMPVQWFPQGNPAETPWAGIMVAQSNTQTIDALVVPRRGKAIIKVGVPYIKDPTLKTMDPSHLDRHGAWDYLPDWPCKHAVAPEDAEVAIRQMYAAGKGTVEIAQALGGNWKHQSVYGYLNKAGLWKEKAPEGADA